MSTDSPISRHLDNPQYAYAVIHDCGYDGNELIEIHRLEDEAKAAVLASRPDLHDVIWTRHGDDWAIKVGSWLTIRVVRMPLL